MYSRVELFFTLRNKFRILHLVTHLLTLIGLVMVIKNRDYSWLFISLFCFLFFGIVGVNISLHRFFAHNSFSTNQIGYWFLLTCSFFPMLGSPIAWGVVHRYHHLTSDTCLDPHNPNHLGKIHAWLTFWPSVEIPLSLYRPFSKDKNLVFLDKYYFHLICFYLFILLLIDWRLPIFVFAIPAVGCFQGASAIAVIPHLNNFFGYRNHATNDNSHNNVIAWFLSLGEGWHNNHHAYPSNYRHGEHWWELDPPAFIIKHFLKSKK